MIDSGKKQFHKAIRGFTLVELLIVIVVIAILAAISIVAYNGIQNRANNMAVKSDLSSAQKILEIYKIDLGWYPRSDTDWGDDFDFSKTAYDRNGYNALYCVNPSIDNFAMVVRSKSGQTYRLTKLGVEELGNVAVTAAMACDPVGTTWDNPSSHTRHGYMAGATGETYTDGWDNVWPWSR